MNLRNLYKWVPSLYLMEGLPYALVCFVAPIIYKNLGVDNTKIALYTSLFAIPWFLKPILSPLLEMASSKQKIILTTQFSIVIFSFMLAMSLSLTHFLYLSGVLFFGIALLSSIHDTNADGFYIIHLNSREQAYFIGIRTLSYQIGKLICQMGLIFVAGILFAHFSKQGTWSMSLFLLSCYVFIMAIYHKKTLPRDVINNQIINNDFSTAISAFKNVFREFFKLQNICLVLLFTVFFNFPEAQLMKVVPLFLLDKVNAGGLNMNVENVGLIYGGLGSICMLGGILLASFILSKVSIKKIFIPVVLFVYLSHALYFLFTLMASGSILFISIIIMINQFCYGLSNAVYMLFLLNIFTKGSYPMSLYAIGSSLMGLGMLLGGAISGYMQSWLGYPDFFMWIVIVGLFIIIISVVQKNYESDYII